MKLVMKFGGTSVADGERIRSAARIVKSHLPGNELIVVTSSLDGVTDQLAWMAEEAERGRWGEVSKAIDALRKKHEEAVAKAVMDEKLRRDTLSATSGLLHELEKVLTGVSILRELSPRSRDYVLSFGERLSAPIVRATLQDNGVASKDLTGKEAGIVSDDNFGEARPLMNITRHHVQRRLAPLLEDGVVPVVTGFIAGTQKGDITTLGRGGSDYTATILAASLDADEVWMWTDVDGLMTADPRLVKDSKVIPQLSYAEAIEMTVFGAKAMHPRALEPIVDQEIPVRVRNTFNPSYPGTLISRDAEVRPGAVAKAVVVVRNVGIVNVSGESMVGMPGTAGRVFDILGKLGVNVMMISQSVSEANISMVVRRDAIHKVVNALEIALLGKGNVRTITFEDDTNVIAIIGAGMKGSPGVAAKVFSAVAERGVNVIMIAQGSSELSISFAVKEKDGAEAVRALHREFGLGAGG